MSEATEAILEAQTDALSQHGTTFTVDGSATVRNGIASEFIYGKVPTDHGMEQRRQCNLHIVATEWTPEIGKRVTVKGLTFVVDAVQSDHASYILTLVESHT